MRSMLRTYWTAPEQDDIWTKSPDASQHCWQRFCVWPAQDYTVQCLHGIKILYLAWGRFSLTQSQVTADDSRNYIGRRVWCHDHDEKVQRG